MFESAISTGFAGSDHSRDQAAQAPVPGQIRVGCSLSSQLFSMA